LQRNLIEYTLADLTMQKDQTDYTLYLKSISWPKSELYKMSSGTVGFLLTCISTQNVQFWKSCALLDENIQSWIIFAKKLDRACTR